MVWQSDNRKFHNSSTQKFSWLLPRYYPNFRLLLPCPYPAFTILIKNIRDNISKLSKRDLCVKCSEHDFLAQLSKFLFSVVSWVHDFNFRTSRSHIFFKIVILKNFAIFTAKHLCRSRFLIKLQAWSPEIFKNCFSCI